VKFGVIEGTKVVASDSGGVLEGSNTVGLSLGDDLISLHPLNKSIEPQRDNEKINMKFCLLCFIVSSESNSDLTE